MSEKIISLSLKTIEFHFSIFLHFHHAFQLHLAKQRRDNASVEQYRLPKVVKNERDSRKKNATKFKMKFSYLLFGHKYFD